MKDTLVMKFGGTSVGSVEAIQQVIEITRTTKDEWQNIAIVVSAMGGVTNELLRGAKNAMNGENNAKHIAHELREKHITALKELAPNAKHEIKIIEMLLEEFVTLCHAIGVLGEASPRALDTIASLGERMNAPLVSSALNESGINARPVDASKMIVTDDIFQSASPDIEATRQSTEQVIQPIFASGQIPVITGFVAANREGTITTLGRGGSDYTGAIMGVVLDAQEIWIWTDVSGVMSTDPRIEPSAHTLSEITYREISELAFYGAKVLHPKSIRPALEHGITLRVKNTFKPDAASTRIIDNELGVSGYIRAVTAIREQCLVTVEGRGMLGVPGIAARLFAAVARKNTSVVMISQGSSEQSICFVIPYSDREIITREINIEFRHEIDRRDIDHINASGKCAIVTVVGAGMRTTPGLAGSIFGAIGEAKINVVAIALGSSECSISLVVGDKEVETSIRAIHRLIIE